MMTSSDRIAIIGAGMAGLACARKLAQAGFRPLVLDKGRGVGGRLATRRGEGDLQFDHGAQYITSQTVGFVALIAEAEKAGAVARWDDASGSQRYVGTPGMTALAKYLARGVDVRLQTEVVALRKSAAGWSVITLDDRFEVGRVVVMAPAPQIITLLEASHPLANKLLHVTLDPCLTLMAALKPGAPRPFVNRRAPNDPLAWIAQDSAKPGRPKTICWVAQADPAWSRRNLELEREEISQRMLPMLCDRLGADRSDVLTAMAHRWRYAHVSRPLGRPYLRNGPGTFFAGGDWSQEARVEAAWISGDAIADAIITGA